MDMGPSGLFPGSVEKRYRRLSLVVPWTVQVMPVSCVIHDNDDSCLQLGFASLRLSRSVGWVNCVTRSVLDSQIW